MPFIWNDEVENSCSRVEIKEVENNHKIILGRETSHNGKIGCCGKLKYDLIYPVGYEPNFQDFKELAYRIVENYPIKKDIYMAEQFEGEFAQDERGNGQSIFLIKLEDGNWNYYENNVLKLSVQNIEELKQKWQE